MGLLAVNGVKINYREAGAGFPLIMIHGLSDSSALWTAIFPKLSTQYRAIALDLRGHGESGKPDMPYSVRLFSEDLLCFIQKLRIQNAHIMGLSLGAAVGQQLALDHPERVRSLTLLSSLSYNDAESRHNLEMLREKVIKSGLSGFFDAIVQLVVTPAFISANADVISEAKKECIRLNTRTTIVHALDACINFNLKDRIPQISQPTLIISGRQDALIPVHLAEEVHRSIENSELKIMEGVGHSLLVPGKISELAEIVLEFLRRQ